MKKEIKLLDRINSLFQPFEVVQEKNGIMIHMSGMFCIIDMMSLINNEIKDSYAAEVKSKGLFLITKSEKHTEKDLSEALERVQSKIKLIIAGEIIGRDVKERNTETEEVMREKKEKIADIFDGVFVRRQKEWQMSFGTRGEDKVQKEGFVVRKVNNAKKVVDKINEITWSEYKTIACHIVKFDDKDRVEELSHGKAVSKEDSTGKRDIFFMNSVLREYDMLTLLKEHKNEICKAMGKVVQPEHTKAIDPKKIKEQTLNPSWGELEI